MLFIKLPRQKIDTKLKITYANPELSYLSNEQRNELYVQKQKIDNLYTTKKGEQIWKYTSRLFNQYETVSYKYNHICSRAYFKLKEILIVFNLLGQSDIVSAHLCEAPGGFIEALVDLCARGNLKLKWYAQSMTSDNNIIPRLKIRNGKIIKHLNSDITKEKIIEHFISSVDSVDLITGDGGFDVSDNFNNQEQKSFNLIYSQIYVSVSVLKKGGSMVIKIFDIFTEPTVQLLAVVASLFEDVWLYKPKTSRPANAEKYIIAKNFIGNPKDGPIELNDSAVHDIGIEVDDEFKKKIELFNRKYVDVQINFIKRVFDYIKNENEHDKNVAKLDQKKTCEAYYNLSGF